MTPQKKNQSLFLISIGLLLFFSFPLMSAANKPVLVLGIPALYFYVFAGWAGFILLIRLATSGSAPKNRKHE